MTLKHSTLRLWALVVLCGILGGLLFSQDALQNRVIASNQPSAAISLGNGRWIVIRLYYDSQERLNAVAGELDIWEVHRDEGYVIAMVPPAQRDWLVSLNYRVEVDEEKTALVQAPLAPLDPRYHYFDSDYENPNGLYVYNANSPYGVLQNINNAYPDLTELIDIGDAWEGTHGGHNRDMWVMRITNENPAYGDPNDKPAFFLMAEIHAREVSTPELAIRYIKYLTSGYNGLGGYGLDADVTWMVDWHVVYVLVMQNPDGHRVDEEDTSAYRRKNMDNDDGCADPGSWGIDLNRNHNFLWGCCGGSSSNPCSETFRGPGTPPDPNMIPDPETLAFQDFIQTVIPDYNGPNGPYEIAPASPITTTGVFISLHSYSDEILWPWYLQPYYPPPPDAARLEAIGRKFAFFNGYDPTGTIGYTVDGSANYWTYGVLGIPAYTFEVGPASGACGGFFPPYGCIDGIEGMPRNFWAENRPVFVYATKIARQPYQIAYGPDTQNLVVVPDHVYPGEPITLNGNVADHRYGSDPLRPITAAEYFVDQPGSDGNGNSMNPADGSWGGLSENVTAVIDTTGLAPGQHYALVHGRNDNGVWGPFTAIFFYINPPVSLTPESAQGQADPGQTIQYVLQVENLSDTPETYNVLLESAWPISATAIVGPVPAGGTAALEVQVTVPTTATHGESDTAIVTVVSQAYPTYSDSSSLLSTANYYEPGVEPESESGLGFPGALVSYTLTLTNLGNITDTFDLSAAGLWTVTLPASLGPLGVGRSIEFVVNVTVPLDAAPGDSDLTTVTISSQGNPAQTAQALLTTEVALRGPNISPNQASRFGDPGATVSYTFQVTNLGPEADTFNITVINADWPTSAPASVGPLGPGETTVLEVDVTIPINALSGEFDDAVIHLTSPLPGSIVATADLCTTANTIYDIAALTEIDAQTIYASTAPVTYTLLVTNTGNITDTFDVAVTTAWLASYQATVGPLGPRESTTLLILIYAPIGVSGGESDLALVTLTSQGNPERQRQLTLTTTTAWFDTYVPILVKQ